MKPKITAPHALLAIIITVKCAINVWIGVMNVLVLLIVLNVMMDMSLIMRLSLATNVLLAHFMTIKQGFFNFL